METRGRQLNQGVAAALAVGLLVWWAVVLGGAFTWVLVPVMLVVWLYLFCVVLLVEWGVARLRGGAPPTLPWRLAPFTGSKRALQVMVAVVVTVTLLREGLLAPDFVLTFEWNSASQNSKWQSNNSAQHQQRGGPPIRLATRHVNCNVRCDPSGAVCSGFLRALHCDSHGLGAPTGAVSVEVALRHPGEPFCYVPLYKSATLTSNVTLDAHAESRTEGRWGTASHNLGMTITTSQTATGFGSCHRFQEKLGRQAALEVAKNLRDYFGKN